MGLEVLENVPYGGQTYLVTRADSLDALPPAARKRVSLYQAEVFRDFPQSLIDLAEKVEIPYVAAWLRGLAQAESCRLEVHLSEYASPAVLLRFMVEPKWSPALGFELVENLPSRTPAALCEVYAAIGRVNLEGYGYAGGLLYPPDKYPALSRYHSWRQEGLIDLDLDGYVAFYQTFSGDCLLYNEAGQTAWYVHDDLDATRAFRPLADALRLIFAHLAQGRPLGPYDEPPREA